MGRHIVSVVVIWAILTAIGYALSLALVDGFPTAGSPEAGDFDQIFRTLLFMGVPVFAFVVSVLGYSFLQFRRRETDSGEDGPAFFGHGWIPRAWLAVTGGLAVLVMISPGLTGLADLQTDKTGHGWGDPDVGGKYEGLLIRVTAQRWSWEMEYPEQGITVNNLKGKELYLPIDTKVKFEIRSADVNHSFWIPAFRMKIDAIQGRTTFVTVEPDRLGSFEDDIAYRVQCAELCGLDHATMQFPVRVVSKTDFAAWVDGLKAGR